MIRTTGENRACILHGYPLELDPTHEQFICQTGASEQNDEQIIHTSPELRALTMSLDGEDGGLTSSLTGRVELVDALLENRSIATMKYDCNMIIFVAISFNNNNVTLVKSCSK
jgi:hypothetical protein